ncbi:MAG: hypothetical protein LRY69_03365 [Gammaproteobacteria bacterium]|nr:hypothetical protein [Gammaproteobacteria bacterium]
MTMYGFTANAVADALVQQQHRGVMVQLLIEKEPYKTEGENKKILRRLKKVGHFYSLHPKILFAHTSKNRFA